MMNEDRTIRVIDVERGQNALFVLVDCYRDGYPRRGDAKREETAAIYREAATIAEANGYNSGHLSCVTISEGATQRRVSITYYNREAQEI